MYWNELFNSLTDVFACLTIVLSIGIGILFAILADRNNRYYTSTLATLFGIILALIFVWFVFADISHAHKERNKKRELKQDRVEKIYCNSLTNKNGNVCIASIADEECVVILRDNHKGTKQTGDREPVMCAKYKARK